MTTITETSEKQNVRYTKEQKRARRRRRTIKEIILRIAVALVTTVLVVLLALLGVILVFEKGPSPTARNIFCITCLETSALKFVPHIFLSNEEVNEITAANAIVSTEELTNTDLVHIPSDNENPTASDPNIDPDGDGIDIFELSGPTYKGRMMVVYDPSRVFVGTCGVLGENGKGKTVDEMCKAYGVSAGINAGAFGDVGGAGNGGTPIGVVISEGKHLWADKSSTWDMVGITNENKLVCGKMTVQAALDMGVRDAVYFGPSLVINGEPLDQLGSGSGLNPRAAIGQRADGAILLLTIDGRQSNSLGASYADVRDQMVKFGAVNAYNLDGGASTTMIYKGETINQSSFLIDYRDVCTGILVRDKE